jgi:ATP-dependent Clp protease ATP-binding subunit ClpB
MMNKKNRDHEFQQFHHQITEAVQKAMEIAAAQQNQAIETSHLLKGMLLVDENVIPYLLKKLNVNLDAFTLPRRIRCLSKVSGENALSGDHQSLQKATSFPRKERMNSSPWSIFLGIFGKQYHLG